ncbi:hypothetical protein [Bacillus licheniformis]|uniref:hypothetical protein n=1 Tax=Bacillus licheniformis TaxID=1402 RepID=UPI002DC04724|nr:hypothetical protein [Bacillus licheniformis]MEC0479054.1 hypothetical protein [Bacillus licheniformis]
MKKILLSLLLIPLLALTACNSVDSSKNTEDEKIADTKKEETFEATEKNIKLLVADELKERGIEDTDKLDSFEIFDDVNKDNKPIKTVLITLNGNDNLTKNMIKKSMLKEGEKLFPRIFEDQSVGRVLITWKFPLEDDKGNSTFQKVLSIQLERETADEINWKKFKYKNFPTVADSYFEHQAFKK